MKTNVPIALTDEQRNKIACLLDGKESKRMITRAEVVTLCQGFIENLTGSREETPGVPKAATARPPVVVPRTCLTKMKERGYTPDSRQGIEYARGWMIAG